MMACSAHRGIYGPGLLYIFATVVSSGLLGALITFAPTPWYPAYARSTTAWSLTPLEVQQLAGLIMWVPPSRFYSAAGSVIFIAWMSVLEARVEREGRVGARPQTDD